MKYVMDLLPLGQKPCQRVVMRLNHNAGDFGGIL
jgi:hypothetical protein